MIERDLFCGHCGYNLRGLSTSSDCPECGLAVQRTLQTERLASMPTDWLRRLHLGTGLMRWTMWIALALAVIEALLFAAGADHRLPVTAWTLVWAVVIAVWFVGMMQVTRGAPAIADDRATRRRQLTLRWLSGLLVVMIFAVVVIQRATDWPPMGSYAASGGFVGGATYAFLLGVAWRLADLYRKLADKIPDPSLARRTRRAQVGFVISGIIGAALAIGLLMLFVTLNLRPARWAVVVAGAGCGSGLIWFYVRGVMLLGRFDVVLRRLVRAGRDATPARPAEGSG